ncbi:hypothetical protein CANARDRAFT_30162 [[Candida] arabinofermentans NRRL YB-2248]|uniref:Uncharacterized protein n=1 Tax=[Candida] arabinofermentans NRRL YB-2248 TaxID=983967 RepID=A0A1E4SUP5_9ASCO|nr:hypothetical protein CANARDRAFT_30162 [[Candida] arabinofermentans NRRL YB-2248]
MVYQLVKLSEFEEIEKFEFVDFWCKDVFVTINYFICYMLYVIYFTCYTLHVILYKLYVSVYRSSSIHESIPVILGRPLPTMVLKLNSSGGIPLVLI